MKSAAICIVIALVAPSATAQPKLEDANERVSLAPQKPKLRDATGWIELASPTPVSHGTEFILMGKARQFSQLRIDATGKVIVLRVRLSFTDGSARTIDVSRILDPKRPSTLIDVPAGKSISQLSVTTERWSRGTYSVHGSAGDNGIAKR
jgi:hypothetical protein